MTISETKEEFTLFDQIEEIAKFDVRTVEGEKAVLNFLMCWWSAKYNRPLKDPILLSYTLEELILEYNLVIQREAAQKERLDEQDDKIDKEKWEEAESWADEMEREEEEREAKLAKGEKVDEPIDTSNQKREAAIQQATSGITPQTQTTYNPLDDPKNIEWMEGQMKLEKEKYGEGFGDDLNLDFDE